MDATRQRRVNGAIRRQWYAHWRLVRFARHLGFVAKTEILGLPEFSFRIVKSAEAPI
jgi:hypothetical protein